MNKIILSLIISLFIFSPAIAENNRVDGLRPDAPELTKPGHYKVGVRSLTLYHKDQIDAVNIKVGEPFPLYDRPLPVEIWYPASTNETGGAYKDVYLRDGKTKATLYGSAVRDAALLKANDGYPLIVVSHGYPGNRILMSHFGENLATKGYVVIAVDHTDSNYENAGAFSSTLYNRPRDQKFLLKTMRRFNGTAGHFLENMVDADNAGLIGYSMGGYGATITAGGGITQSAVDNADVSPDGLLKVYLTGSKAYEDFMSRDNFKAILSIGPWGMERGFWDDKGLKGVRIPTLYVAGSKDTTSGYEAGTKAIYQKSLGTDRYLLTFENAGHNAAAPIPAPKESYTVNYPDSDRPVFGHYADPVWDTIRMNNIAQHYATALFGKYLKQDVNMDKHLILIPKSKGLLFEKLSK